MKLYEILKNLEGLFSIKNQKGENLFERKINFSDLAYAMKNPMDIEDYYLFGLASAEVIAIDFKNKIIQVQF